MEIWISIVGTVVINGTTLLIALMTRKTNEAHVHNVEHELGEWKAKYQDLKDDYSEMLREINDLKIRLAACEEARALWAVEKVKFLERFAREEVRD